MSRVGSGRVVDAGLQNERTALAWFRTGLSFTGAGALLLHSSGGLTRPLPGVLGALTLAAGGAAVLAAERRYRTTDAAVRGGRPAAPPAWLVAGTAGLTMVLSLALLVADLVGVA